MQNLDWAYRAALLKHLGQEWHLSEPLESNDPIAFVHESHATLYVHPIRRYCEGAIEKLHLSVNWNWKGVNLREYLHQKPLQEHSQMKARISDPAAVIRFAQSRLLKHYLPDWKTAFDRYHLRQQQTRITGLIAQSFVNVFRSEAVSGHLGAGVAQQPNSFSLRLNQSKVQISGWVSLAAPPTSEVEMRLELHGITPRQAERIVALLMEQGDPASS